MPMPGFWVRIVFWVDRVERHQKTELRRQNCYRFLVFGLEDCSMTKSQVANLLFVDESLYVKIFQRLAKKLLIIVITVWDT